MPEKVITLTKPKQTKIDSLLYKIKKKKTHLTSLFHPLYCLSPISNLEVLWSDTDHKAQWGLQILNAMAQSNPKPHFFLFHELCHTDKYLIRKLKGATWNSRNKPKSMRLQYALRCTSTWQFLDKCPNNLIIQLRAWTAAQILS